MDLEQSFKNLKQSPMFAISLSSKELFHSNFWAWLIEYNPEYSKVFFDDIDFNNKLFVKREEKNRDLSIHLNQMVYIIENKLKSLPSREQIEEYQKKEPSFCKGCLTGVVRLEDLPNNWCFKSYKEIGTSILKINEKYQDDKWYFLIKEYANIIIEIENILVSFSESYGHKLISQSQYDKYPILKDFEDIRFADILKKAKANDFVNYLISSLKEELDNLLKNSDFNLYIGSWFSNKSSLVDVRIIKNKDTDNQVVIGIQIQDNQYRLCVERRKGTLNFNNENALNELFNEFLNFGWFENYNKESKQIKNKITSMREMFCKYNTDIYKFIYQYYNLNENDLKFENLITQIRKDMLLAIDISNKIN